MIALIDGDIVAYRVGFSCERKVGDEIEVEPIEVAYARCDELVQRILDETDATSYHLYLSGSVNYRHSYNPEYKANRIKLRKPHHLISIREYLITRWNAEVTDGIEADDALGIMQTPFTTTDRLTTIICTIDKDLKQIPGRHYNFVTGEFDLIDPVQGLNFFYQQLLIGDTVDNIFGVRQVGKVKAERLLRNCSSELEMFEAVQSMYDTDERLLMNGICLKIQTYPGEIWKFPDGSTSTIEQSETEQAKLSVQIELGSQDSEVDSNGEIREGSISLYEGL